MFKATIETTVSLKYSACHYTVSRVILHYIQYPDIGIPIMILSACDVDAIMLPPLLLL